jgi:hypothetical protein
VATCWRRFWLAKRLTNCGLTHAMLTGHLALDDAVAGLELSRADGAEKRLARPAA